MMQCSADTPQGDKTVYAPFAADGSVADVCSTDEPDCEGFKPPTP